MEFNLSENTFLFQDLLLKVSLGELSMQKLLRQRLYTAARCLFSQRELLIDFTEKDIPLSRLKAEIGYRCAIALQLARQQNLSSVSLAQQLLSDLTRVCVDVSDRLQLDFTVRLKESGWIEFRPSDGALAIWLQQVLETINLQEQDLLKEITANLFNMQYAHARCCSLLGLGDREGLIQLHQMQWKYPYPIPWLDKNNNLRLIHPTEFFLIGQMIETIDAFNADKNRNWTQLGMLLSEAVLECDRACRIMGEVRRNDPELSQARLGLYAIAQRLLQKLLEEKIGIWAPIKL